ncbi:MAG: phosphoribosyl-AMP cyclohydrolase [Methanobrevibacter sp.]|nr:phosphoribosyl-AMP cyclohydrolase [Candidatus Methanovirga aequatorialis]
MGGVNVINFKRSNNGQDLIIAVTQDYKTLQVLMVAYMNEKALKMTLKTKKVHYWSTSRNELWLKGESSGNFQFVKEVLVDCDMDSVLLKVEQIGGACHVGYKSCFFRELNHDNKIAEKSYNLNDDDLNVVLDKVFNPDDVY